MDDHLLQQDRPTEREFEVLRLVMEGCSNIDVAEQLFVSAQTVKSHVANCLSKLGARDRTHAVVMALRTGQISLAHPLGRLGMHPAAFASLESGG